MPAAPLTPAQSSVVASAAALLEQGRVVEAANAVVPVIQAGCRHPDPLMIYAVACEQLGQVGSAIDACRAAVEASPERGDLAAELGRMLYENGQAAEGMQILERAVAGDPSNTQAWYNLGLAAGEAGSNQRALEAMTRAAELEPHWPMAWGGLGFFQEQAGDLEGAESSLRRAIELDPSLASARHALVVALRKLDKLQEALEVSASATAPETRLVRAHVLGEMGSPEAADAYRSVLAERPDFTDGHGTYARLMPQINRAAEALDTYERALASRPSPELYRSALASAQAIGNSEAMRRWAAEAERRFGADAQFQLYRGLAARMEGDVSGALALIEPLALAGTPGMMTPAAETSLMLHDLDRAERYALAATEVSSADQAAWAVLTIAWRMRDDPREHWLADYDRFVMPIDVEAPEMSELAVELHALHNTSSHPPDQSLREGTQTRGQLFARRSPMIQTLAEQVRRQVSERIAGLPEDHSHPFLSRNNGKVDFAGSWSVRLRSGGFHVSHIHQEGWLSSALYVELPPSILEAGRRADPGEPSEGVLTFGVPSSLFGLDLRPRRIELPRVGRLVVFPSYFWHGTVPFQSEAPRLTVAFDLVPRP